MLRSRRPLVAVVSALLLVAAAACTDPLATPEGPAPLRYRDDVFSGVTRTQDIAYGTAANQSGQTVTLRLDLYEPTGDTVASRPAIVWVHGGSFAGGSKTSAELVDEANVFGRKGFVSVSINYRVVSGGCTAGSDLERCLIAINQAREDAQTAVRFLRAQAATYRIDPTRIAIGGSSAGAITALNVGYTPEDPGSGDHQGFSSAVRAVQSLSGAELVSGPIDAGDAPALLFHGTNDALVPYEWAQDTVARATDAGLLVLLRTWEGGGHVPYSQHRTQILDETRNFFYSQMDLAHAAR